MPKKEPSKSAKFARSLLAMLFIVAISVGVTVLVLDYFGLGKGGSVEAATAESAATTAPLATPIFAPLDPFTVTLDNSHRSRVLYVAITLRLEDQASAGIVRTYMPETRDRTLRLLALQDPEKIQTPEGRASLVSQLKQVLSAPYSPQPNGPRIRDVLFTAFVVQ
ncbi:flagellar protein FliL [Pusillimonas sp. TS35]|uniref:flagellar basal body-associated FliL family protein n=1 Tax=Paracandidimonas lactea TaxID=2895524 RepID=UPI00136ED17E|nr:flagellar basal body-associated FliL family protein [Paracandidimonas lactea]MYN11653.1 flagellar protein FliL [Pusillimonas sp. TS35]